MREGDPAARRLRAQHAKPVITAEPFAGVPLVAAESWRILARGYRPTRFRLEERKVTLSPFWSRLALGRIMNRILPAYETYLCQVVRGADILIKLSVVK